MHKSLRNFLDCAYVYKFGLEKCLPTRLRLPRKPGDYDRVRHYESDGAPGYAGLHERVRQQGRGD